MAEEKAAATRFDAFLDEHLPGDTACCLVETRAQHRLQLMYRLVRWASTNEPDMACSCYFVFATDARAKEMRTAFNGWMRAGPNSHQMRRLTALFVGPRADPPQDDALVVFCDAFTTDLAAPNLFFGHMLDDTLEARHGRRSVVLLPSVDSVRTAHHLRASHPWFVYPL